ncbi:hypothetical protein ABZP36_019592 [Zizania latifolia]
MPSGLTTLSPTASSSTSPRGISNTSLSIAFSVLAEAMKGFPQLEELDITIYSLCGDVCQSIGKACPQLKCFRLYMDCGEDWGVDDDTEALGIANNMPELRELQLIDNCLTKDGLISIVDNWLHLESVDIRQCYNIRMDDALKSKWARIRNLKLPHDSISDFKYCAYMSSSVFLLWI